MAADCSSALAGLVRVSQQGFSLQSCGCFLLLFARRLFHKVRQLMKLWGYCLVRFFVGFGFFFSWILWPIINTLFSSPDPWLLGCVLMTNQLLSGLWSKIQLHSETRWQSVIVIAQIPR